MGILDVFSDKNEKAAAQSAERGYTQGLTSGTTYLNDALQNAKGDYASALGVYQPYATAGTNATGLYSDALGLNGAEGSANAKSMFSASPGYQYSTDQAIQALERRAASQGQLGSGQTGLDTLASVYGLANNDYSSWLDRLSGLSSQGLSAAGGQAGAYGGMAGAELSAGSALAGLNYNAWSGIGNAYSDYEKSKDNSGANIIGAITGAASLGAKALGLGGFGG